MIYYEPSEHGLETVHEFEAYPPDYTFDLLVVWRETASGKLWAATDSGCSCPVPFEDHTFPTDFSEVRSWQDVKELLDSAFPRDGYRARNDHSRLRSAVKNALMVQPQDPPQEENPLAYVGELLEEVTALRGAVSPPKGLSDPGAILRSGDALQSAASRLAEYVRSLDYNAVPYEVSMAALEAQGAVEAWTEARTSANAPSEESA